METTETINDRIQQIINEEFGGNKAAFAKSIGMPPTGMSSYLGKQRRSKPSVDMVAKIVVALGADARWLLLGGKGSAPASSTPTTTAEEKDRQIACLEAQNRDLTERLLKAQAKIIKLMEGNGEVAQ